MTGKHRGRDAMPPPGGADRNVVRREKVRRGRLARCATNYRTSSRSLAVAAPPKAWYVAAGTVARDFRFWLPSGGGQLRAIAGEARASPASRTMASAWSSTWGDGLRSRLHAVWLRDNCACTECRDPVTGQRLFDIAALPEPISMMRRGRRSGESSPDLLARGSSRSHRCGMAARPLRRSAGVGPGIADPLG